jgi:hypothetical protein
LFAGEAQQIGHLGAQLAIVKTVDEVLKQSQREKQ